MTAWFRYPERCKDQTYVLGGYGPQSSYHDDQIEEMYGLKNGSILKTVKAMFKKLRYANTKTGFKRELNAHLAKPRLYRSLLSLDYWTDRTVLSSLEKHAVDVFGVPATTASFCYISEGRRDASDMVGKDCEALFLEHLLAPFK